MSESTDIVPPNGLSTQEYRNALLEPLVIFFSRSTRDSQTAQTHTIELKGIEYHSNASQLRFLFDVHQGKSQPQGHVSVDQLTSWPDILELEHLAVAPDLTRQLPAASSDFTTRFDEFESLQGSYHLDVNLTDTGTAAVSALQAAVPLTNFFHGILQTAIRGPSLARRPKTVTLTRITIGADQLTYSFQIKGVKGPSWQTKTELEAVPSGALIDWLGERYRERKRALTEALISQLRGSVHTKYALSISTPIPPRLQSDETNRGSQSEPIVTEDGKEEDGISNDDHDVSSSVNDEEFQGYLHGGDASGWGVEDSASASNFLDQVADDTAGDNFEAGRDQEQNHIRYDAGGVGPDDAGLESPCHEVGT